MVPAVIYHRLWTIGYPLPSADFDRELTVLTPDTVAVRNLMAGAYAADVGRWDAFERAQANARRAVALTGGASSADLSNPIARALDAYGEARRGRIPEARAELELVRASATGAGGGYVLNSIVRWWLGEISFTAGRTQDALRYFQTFGQDPIGQFMLGRVYETMGDTTRARRAYSIALEAWADADPEFPLVEEARSALSRLGA
jgi:predicted Zn-dependent protease